MFHLKILALALMVMVTWVLFLGITSLYGWWSDPIAARGDTAGFVQAATDIIEEGSRGNVAFLLVEDGETVAEYYASHGDREPIHRDTLFPTASLSKWVTAVGVMQLVEQGRVDLDRPVSTYLTRWQVPDGEYDNNQVTTRRLLSHTSGLTDGLGFGDYEAHETVPPLEQSLAAPRASSGREAIIAVGRPPGEAFEYSGGGYLILQLLIEEVSGQDFAAFMKEAVLRPLGMSRSTYGFIGGAKDAARSYDESGKLAPWYQYAAAGATGLAASAADLERFLKAQLPGARDRSPFDPVTISAMREPQASTLGADIWGLGTMLYAPTSDGEFVFGHDGGNDPAINSSARINPDTGDGIVVLVTGHKRLATMLGSEWVFWQTGLPDFLSSGEVLRGVIPAMVTGCLLSMTSALALMWRHQRALRAIESPLVGDQDE